MVERCAALDGRRANASASLVEATADRAIMLVNLPFGNLRFEILVFSAAAVLIGARLGALLSPRPPARLLKTLFSLCVLGIVTLYVYTSPPALL